MSVDQRLSENHRQTVASFCEAWERLDVEGILSLMSEDAVYHNVPLAPLTGHNEIRGFLIPFLSAASACKFEILTIVADGERVVTERLDSFSLPSGDLDELPVLGIFEFDSDGKIKQWREYFDLKTWVDKGGPALG